MRIAIAVLGLAVLGAAASAAAPDALELELRLPGALRPPAPATDPGPSLVLDLARTGDRWERVWGVESDSRYAILYWGRVRRADISDKQVTLDIAVQGKNASRVQVDLVRAADGRLSGAYTVTTPAGPNTGPADGRIKPARPPVPAGYVPVKPGEHPRILFRAADLPRLREKARSPLGQALLARMGQEKAYDAIGAGVKWQLTGEKAEAELARALAAQHMAGKGPGYSARTSKGRHPEQVALAFDLCYDAWPEDFKAQVVDYMVKTANTYIGHMPGNMHVCSNWNARVHAGAGFITLALWGEKGPRPPRPAEAEGAALAFWEDEVKDHERLGQVNMDYQRLFERVRYLEYLFSREATGTGGFRGENAHYGLLAAEMGLEYAACHRQMFGADVSPYGDLAWMVPRMMFGHDYPEPDGKPAPLHINGYTHIDGEFFAYAYPIAPARWKESVLWAWDRFLGVEDAHGLAKQVAAETGVDTSGVSSWIFLGYPLDGRPRHPRETMPLTWEAPDHGYYGFRSGWTGRGDFVLQVHAKAHFTGGWNSPNAGTFRLYGRGQSWNETSSARDANAWEENRVMMPDDPVNLSGQGRVTRVAFQPDGSGAVTIDMNDVYGGQEGRLYTMYGNFRYPSGYKDLGIRGVRAMAVDYSGRSGAPCLFVLVDRLRGGGAKVWTWNLGDAALPKVEVAGNTFALPKGAATLRGVFIAPKKAEIKALVHEVKMGAAGKETVRKIPSLHAQGGDDFFLVATVQDAGAPPPAVKVEGAGLDAKVTVGKRLVTFDGEKVLIVGAP
jgi:hypothetical protein